MLQIFRSNFDTRPNRLNLKFPMRGSLGCNYPYLIILKITQTVQYCDGDLIGSPIDGCFTSGYCAISVTSVIVLSRQHAVLQKITVVDSMLLKSFSGEGIVAISWAICNCSS